jgi:hypothetical protein
VFLIEALREPHHQVLQLWSGRREIRERFRTKSQCSVEKRRIGAQGLNRIVYDAIDLERFFEWLFF